MRCELTKEACETDTHQPLTASEIEALPRRKTWYGIVGTAEIALDPRDLTDSAELARARATTANADMPSCGPWHVVTLTENLRTPV